MKLYITLLTALILMSGCEKFLNEKPDKRLSVPGDNLENMQLLLNDVNAMNQQVPSSGEIGSDNFYLSGTQWSTLSQSTTTGVNLYIWERNVFNDNDRNDWTLAYKAILSANLVLDGLNKITPSAASQLKWNNLKGQALFFRSFYFYNLLQEFAIHYRPETAGSDAGIALRLEAAIGESSTRASVKDCYDRVIADLREAAVLLPRAATFKTNPNQVAATGLLARVLLTIGRYPEALTEARKYLNTSPALIDFNTLTASATYPVKRYNEEVNFHASLFNQSAYGASYARVDDGFFSQYATSDLRRTVFFRNSGAGNITFKGSYDGSRLNFAGIATDEVYLIAAECEARAGNTTEALNLLNNLLIKRWRTGSFVPFSASNPSAALSLILTERRKELLFRNLRWSDLRRLNLEEQFQKTLSRSVNGQTYQLPPNDNRYVLPLPVKVVQLSGMALNP
jgi:tetratricopeptide (TPR) repeat protein